MESLEQEMQKFTEGEILFLVFQAALTRGYPYLFYDSNAEEKRKRCLKMKLQEQLNSYARKVHDEPRKITEIISDFQSEINAGEYTDIMQGKRITFGRVQKLLNLYLKYHWVFICNKEKEPPHCPIDSIILCRRDIRWEGRPSWTNPQFTQDRYSEAMELCRKAAEARGWSIAEWELRTFRTRSDS